MTLKKSRDFHEKLTFLENAQVASRKLLGCVWSSRECFRVHMQLFWIAQSRKENSENFDIFPCLMTFFSVVQLFGGCRSRIRGFRSAYVRNLSFVFQTLPMKRQKEKAPRVPRAVNIGWRFTARTKFSWKMKFLRMVQETWLVEPV